MKKQNIIIGVIAVIVIIIVAVLIGHHGGSTSSYTSPTSGSVTTSGGSNPNPTTTPIPVTEVASSSNGVTLYTNNELGFSVDYPTSWKVEADPSGPSFTIPLTIAGKDPSTQNTIATLASSIYITSGACMFPTLGATATTKVSTTTVGSNSFGTLSVQNSTNSLNYTDMMYTWQQGSGKDLYCYVFSFGAIAKKTSNGADQTNNGSIISEATQEFTAMVKSFKLVTGPAGQSESSHPSGK
jgi:hypothetical protein